MPEDKVRKVLKIAKEPISMETPIGDDEDSHLGDFIEDNTIHSPGGRRHRPGMQEATKEVLAGLTAREAKVLRMRFGIDMNTDHTLEKWANSSTLPASASATWTTTAGRRFMWYVSSAGSGSYGSLAAYAVNRANPSPPSTCHPCSTHPRSSRLHGSRQVCRGGQTDIRSFPIYRKDDSNAAPAADPPVLPPGTRRGELGIAAGPVVDE